MFEITGAFAPEEASGTAVVVVSAVVVSAVP